MKKIFLKIGITLALSVVIFSAKAQTNDARLTDDNSIFTANYSNTGFASDQTSGIADQGTADGSLLAYPNPVASTVTIVLPQLSTQTVTVDVIDLNGNIARSYKYIAGTLNLGVDMSRLQTGLYNARVMEGDVVLDNIKLIKE